MNLKELLSTLKETEGAIHDYFSFVGDWHVYPIEDLTNTYWYADDHSVFFQEKEPSKAQTAIATGESEPEELEYSSTIVKTFNAEGFTAFVTDTHSNTNVFFSIFDNDKRISLCQTT